MSRVPSTEEINAKLNDVHDKMKITRDREAELDETRRAESLAFANEAVADSDFSINAEAPRIPIEQRIKEIEERQAAMTPEQRTSNLIQTVDRQILEYQENKKKGDEERKIRDELTAEQIRSGKFQGDYDALIQNVQRLESNGVYITEAQKQRAEARQEFGIVAVPQIYSEDPQKVKDSMMLQDIRSGSGTLMTPDEIVAAGDRFDAYHETIRQINREERRKSLEQGKQSSKNAVSASGTTDKEQEALNAIAGTSGVSGGISGEAVNIPLDTLESENLNGPMGPPIPESMMDQVNAATEQAANNQTVNNINNANDNQFKFDTYTLGARSYLNLFANTNINKMISSVSRSGSTNPLEQFKGVVDEVLRQKAEREEKEKKEKENKAQDIAPVFSQNPQPTTEQFANTESVSKSNINQSVSANNFMLNDMLIKTSSPPIWRTAVG
jgi:hypothetical protein